MDLELATSLSLEEVDKLIRRGLQYFPHGDDGQRWTKSSNYVWDALEKAEYQDFEQALHAIFAGMSADDARSTDSRKSDGSYRKW